MSPDALEARLRQDWRQGAADPEAIARGFALRRRLARRRFALAAAGALIILAGLVWLGGLAASRADLRIAVAALAFAAALPATAAALWILRRQAGRAYDATPAGVLAETRDRLAVDRRLLRGADGCAAILVLAAAGLGLMAATGRAPVGAVWLPAALWLLTAAGVQVWRSRRAARLARAAAQLDSLIAEFERADQS